MKSNIFIQQKVVIINLIINIWQNISNKRRIQFIILCLITIVNSFAEILSLSIIVPFLGILVNREEFFENEYIRISQIDLALLILIF